MQTFSTEETRHNFQVDGREFFIPAVSIGDALEFAALADMEAAEQAEKFGHILASKVQPLNRTLWERITGKNPAPTALDKLSIRQKSELFKEWAATAKAVPLGESSSSAGSL